MKLVITGLFVSFLSLQNAFADFGQSGNGDFAFKDKARYAEAINLINAGIKDLIKKANKASESDFDDLPLPVDRDIFLMRIFDVSIMANVTGQRVHDGKVEVLMLDYHCHPEPAYAAAIEALLGKCTVIYAPMVMAIMYMDDKGAAMRFLQIELIHEILHHFDYGENQAEQTAQVIYQRLFN